MKASQPFSFAAMILLWMASLPAALGQCLPAAIVGQPRNVLLPACSSDCAEFNVVAGGSGQLRYQWLLNDVVLPKGTQAKLSICPVTAKDLGKYRVVVMNECGAVTSQVATLTIAKDLAPPAIQCPSNITVWTCASDGANVAFPAPAASDADGATLRVDCSERSGAHFPMGSSLVRCVAMDACGNRAECEFTVTVRLDTTKTMPSIQSAGPALVGTAGESPLAIRGEGFGPADEILIGGILAPVVSRTDTTRIRCLTPPLPAGAHVVELRRCGEVLAKAPNLVTADHIARLDAVDPAVVPAHGGALVILHGAGFRPDTIFRVAFPAAPGWDNRLTNVHVAEDGRTATGEVSALPEGELFGSRAVLAEDARGRSVLEAGIKYVPKPEVKDGQFLAMEQLHAVSRFKPSFQFRNGFPVGIHMSVTRAGATSEASARSFFDQFKGLYLQTQPEKDLYLLRTKFGAGEHLLFGQTFLGVPVFGAQVLVSMSDQEIYSVVGKLLPTASLVRLRMSTVPTLPAVQAEEAARKHAERPRAPLRAETVLEMFDLSLLMDVAPNPKLVWHVRLGGGGGESFVDAQSGEVVFFLAPEQTNGGSLHDFDFDMQDAENEANAADDDCFWSSDDVDVADEDWFNSDYNGDPDAVQGNQHARNTYAFFHNHFDWHSYDDDSSQLEVFIHATVDNASWTPGCDLIQFATGWVDFEVMVHEFTHGIIGSTSDLVYSFQSGALNESFADIMSLVADREAGDLNWTVGEDRTGFGGFVRDMENPGIDRFSEYNPDPNGDGMFADNGGVHSNSGIANKTAFLMASGGTFNFIPVPAMGLGKMRELKFASLRLLPSTADFATARSFEIAIAQFFVDHGMHGFVSDDVCSVRNAWAAVEIGLPDMGCDGDEDVIDMDGDSIPNWADNCPITPNPGQDDADGDGVGDVCDNCPSKANANQKDTDDDGQGDACDPDIDNDGCDNNADQHPNDASVPVGKYMGVCCDGTIYGFEGLDSDMDGDLNCEDFDDDNDGTPDNMDGCPTGDFGFLGCTEFADCACPPKFWFLECMFGDCVQLFAKFTWVVNPDPTREVIVDKISMVSQRLYLFPSTGNTMDQLAGKILQGGAAGPGLREGGLEPYQLEIWERATADHPARRLSIVGAFDPATVRMGSLDLGQILAVLPSTDPNVPFTIGATWFIGGDPAFAGADSDGDGMVDGWETAHGLNPRDPRDAFQDADGDGSSNLEEQAAGTDPRNPSDAFAILRIEVKGALVQIQFNTVEGGSYLVQQTKTLTEAKWEDVIGPIAGTGKAVSVEIPRRVDVGLSFFRVRKQVQVPSAQ